MRTYDSIGVGAPEILLPRADTDWTRWAVIACDQFTSEPAYWQQVEALVGDSPSTLHLIYPEVYLGGDDAAERIARIRATMTEYLDRGVLVSHPGMVYVERGVGDRSRRGLVLCLDLERYDYRPGSASLIRATEGTIVDRLPPRVRIRQGAPLELPHIMVLIDDPDDRVIGPVQARRSSMPKLYDFELMMGSGKLCGYGIQDRELEQGVVAALEQLAQPEHFRRKYGLERDYPVLLYAMGDGNHSLATAKAIWERCKEEAPSASEVMHSRARHALVELVNVHDAALGFEPIHRVLFSVADGRDALGEMAQHYAGRFEHRAVASIEQLEQQLAARQDGLHRIGVVSAAGYGLVEIRRPDSNLAVGSLQTFLDRFMEDGGASQIDYVHGAGPVETLGRKPGNLGFYLPAMDKQELFKSVILDGALPRKTFSMGEAQEKRFYVECRKL